jgi:hypothetical protein
MRAAPAVVLWAAVAELTEFSEDKDGLEDKVEAALADLNAEELAMEDLPNQDLDVKPHDIKEAEEAVTSENDIIDDWVNFMHDFEAKMLVQFHLKGHHTQNFFEEVKAGQLIRGAFFSSADDVGADISFSLLSTTRDAIVEQTATEGVFHVEAKEDGVYRFDFQNSAYFQTKAVTFTLGVSDKPKLSTHTLDSTGEKINQMLHLANDAQSETHYMWTREATRLKQSQATHRRVVHFALLQFSVYALVTAFQLFYVKGLLSDRRVL